jgi:hypothetical protein
VERKDGNYLKIFVQMWIFTLWERKNQFTLLLLPSSRFYLAKSSKGLKDPVSCLGEPKLIFFFSSPPPLPLRLVGSREGIWIIRFKDN